MVLSVLSDEWEMEEGKGFEPSIRYERIHAFQACALNHSATPPENYKLSNLTKRWEKLLKQITSRNRYSIYLFLF